MSVFLQALLERDFEEAKHFLHCLRAWRQDEGCCVRLLLTGSLGLPELLQDHDLTELITDMAEFRLGPFQAADAGAMVQEVALRQGKRLSEAALSSLLEQVGWLSPYYVNLLLYETLEMVRGISGPIEADHVATAFERLMAKRASFSAWISKLEKRQSQADIQASRALLNTVSKQGTGRTRAQLLQQLAALEPDPARREAWLRRLLRRLEDHGFLSLSGPRITFISPLLREYWKRHHA